MDMNGWKPFIPSMAATGVGAAALAMAVIDGSHPSGFAMVVASIAAPIAVLLAVRTRLDRATPVRALIGGGTIGPLVALLTHAFVAAFAVAFFLGFAASGRRLLHALAVEPKISAVITSPWFVLFLVELALVAPVTEEAGKFLGARLAHPTGRRDAFLAGVAAGAGFAMIENVLYALAALRFGGAWTAVVVARTVGVAVHPLATGSVVVGWWDRRHGDARAGLRRMFTGVGVHALWNGTVVVFWVATTAGALGGELVAPDVAQAVFAAALGAALAAALWRATVRVAGDDRTGFAPDRVPAVASWIFLTASMLIPVSVLVLRFPLLRPG
jgi:RsiW-degrading membrane proteinase PrsW (M82 family)